MMRYVIYPLLLLLILAPGCEKKKALTEAEVDHFARAYVDYLVRCASDSATIDMQSAHLDSALKKEGLSKSEFDRIQQALQKDPLAYMQFIDKIVDPLQAHLPAKTEETKGSPPRAAIPAPPPSDRSPQPVQDGKMHKSVRRPPSANQAQPPVPPPSQP